MIESAVANHIVAITAIVLGLAWLIVWTVVDEWRKVRVTEQNAVLKKSMIDRGFTADEIVRVLETSPQPTETTTTNDMPAALIAGGYSGEDITGVTAAMDRCPGKIRDNLQRTVVKMIESGYDGKDIVSFIDGRVATVEGTTFDAVHAR